MEVTKSQELTSADKKAIGFDYQFLYFVYRALELKPNQKIGYEVKDDVHLELEDGSEILIQLKHSIQSKADNSIINMTEKDIDLWKSLYNWNCGINDIDKDNRLSYIRNVKFVLVTNKNNKDNAFFKQSIKFKNNELTIEDYKEYIKGLKCENEDSEYSKKINKYMDSLLNQDADLLIEFIKKIEFSLGFDDLIEKIKEQILSKFIDERKLNDVFERCIGNLTIWKYQTVKKHKKLIITFEDIDKRIKNCFLYGRSNKFPRNIKLLKLPEKIEQQEFIKELIEIEDVKKGQLAKMARYTGYRLKIENFLNEWIQEGYLTETERDEFIEESIFIWSNYHQKAHRSSNKELKKGRLDNEELEELLCDNAKLCLDNIRDKTLIVCDEQLSLEESNGTFYSLSEQRQIGWKFEWERKYQDE